VRLMVGGFLVWLGFRVIGMKADGWSITKADGSHMSWDMKRRAATEIGR
jgi:hypothetical protein